MVLALTSVFSLFGQGKKKGIIQVNVSVDINASADKVWDILGKQFAEIDKWSSTVITSKVVSFDSVPDGIVASRNSKVAGRTTTSKALTATEILTEYSDENREFTFVSANTPKFLEYGRNHSYITDLGNNTCKVTFEVEMKINGILRLFKGKFKKKFIKAMTQVHQDLKVYAETGKVNTEVE